MDIRKELDKIANDEEADFDSTIEAIVRLVDKIPPGSRLVPPREECLGHED